MAPMIDLGGNVKDYKEDVLPPEAQHDLRCKDIVEHTKKDEYGNEFISSYRVMVTVEGKTPEGDNYAPIFHYLAMPSQERDTANDEAKSLDPGTTTRMKMLNIRRFLELFQIPYSAEGFNSEDVVGATARAAIKHQAMDNGGISANIVLPRLD